MIINNVKDFVKFLGDEEISIRNQLDSCIKMAAKICGCQKSKKQQKSMNVIICTLILLKLMEMLL